MAGVVIAYEPLWAIGTGHGATPADAQQMAAAIRGVVAEIAAEAATTVRIQYGGSVTDDGAGALLAEPDVDGALIGGDSLIPERFAEIVAAIAGLNAETHT